MQLAVKEARGEHRRNFHSESVSAILEYDMTIQISTAILRIERF
jgi:hypothetical protein